MQFAMPSSSRRDPSRLASASSRLRKVSPRAPVGEGRRRRRKGRWAGGRGLERAGPPKQMAHQQQAASSQPTSQQQLQQPLPLPPPALLAAAAAPAGVPPDLRFCPLPLLALPLPFAAAAGSIGDSTRRSSCASGWLSLCRRVLAPPAAAADAAAAAAPEGSAAGNTSVSSSAASAASAGRQGRRQRHQGMRSGQHLLYADASSSSSLRAACQERWASQPASQAEDSQPPSHPPTPAIPPNQPPTHLGAARRRPACSPAGCAAPAAGRKKE